MCIWPVSELKNSKKMSYLSQYNSAEAVSDVMETSSVAPTSMSSSCSSYEEVSSTVRLCTKQLQ